MVALLTRGLGTNLLLTHGLGVPAAAAQPVEVIPLITEQDAFEVVRDKICEILAFESASQMAQAVDAGMDPAPWHFSVYRERSDPWECFRSSRESFVSVEFDSDTIDEGNSDAPFTQVYKGRFNVDCYSCGVSSETATGHAPGDEAARIEAHRMARIVRRILAHPKYLYLGYNNTGAVWGITVVSRQPGQPPSDRVISQHVAGVRLKVDVQYNETITTQEPVIINLIGINYKYDPDGRVVLGSSHEVTT